MLSVILAGGQGTRLRPLTSNQPKPMISVANRPLMEHIVDLLREHGFKECVVTLQFLPTIIANHFGDGSDWEVNMNYVTEESPLGTAGSVRNAMHLLNETFVIVSGDALTDIDLTECLKFHKSKDAMVTIVLKSVENPLEFGIVVTDEDGRILRFLEKPSWGEVFSDTINTGIYVMEPEVLSYIPDGEPYDFSHDLFPQLLEKGFPLYGYVSEGYWCDVGNIEQYISVHKDILDGKAKVNIQGHRSEQGVWVGDGVNIDDGVNLRGPILLGNHVTVEEGASLREYTVLGDNVVVKNSSFLHRAVIQDNTYIGPSCHLRGCVVGGNCDIKAGVRIEEGSVVGNGCLIGENSLVAHDVNIFPFKTVDSRATVNNSIIWESRGMRSVCGKRGVSGLINIDITPELAVRLGMAFGSSLPLNSQVVSSRDYSRAARILKRAIMTGLNSTGIHIQDLEVNAVPVNRFTIISHQCGGGVDVRTSADDAQSVEIRFFTEEGIDIDLNAQRKIERILSRGDFRRAFFNEIGEIIFPPRAVETYVRALIESIDVNAASLSEAKIILDYGYGASSLILPAILGHLNLDVMSLNAFVNERHQVLSRAEQKESLGRLGEMVTSFNADAGFMFDSACETIYFVDEKGKVVSPLDLLLLMVNLAAKQSQGGKIVVPVNLPDVVEAIAKEHGCEIIRCGLSKGKIMEAAQNGGVIFAGGVDGGFIFPEFLPAYDAMSGFVKIVEFTSAFSNNVSSLLESIPVYHLKKREIIASWEYKGIIMREILESHQDENLETIDGVKIIFDSNNWILILPDPEEPKIHLYAEGKSDKECDRLLDEYSSQVKKVMA